MTSGSSTTLANQYVRDVMTREVTTVTPSVSIEQAAHMMKTLNVGVLPVCEGTQLVGMLTDRDIVIRVVAEQRSPGETTVRDAMTADATYCYEDQTVEGRYGLWLAGKFAACPSLVVSTPWSASSPSVI